MNIKEVYNMFKSKKMMGALCMMAMAASMSAAASANQHSVRSVQAAVSGNTCGYDLNN